MKKLKSFSVTYILSFSIIMKKNSLVAITILISSQEYKIIKPLGLKEIDGIGTYILSLSIFLVKTLIGMDMPSFFIFRVFYQMERKWRLKGYQGNLNRKEKRRSFTNLSLLDLDKQLPMNSKSFLENLGNLKDLAPNLLRSSWNTSQVLAQQVFECQNRWIQCGVVSTLRQAPAVNPVDNTSKQATADSNLCTSFFSIAPEPNLYVCQQNPDALKKYKIKKKLDVYLRLRGGHRWQRFAEKSQIYSLQKFGEERNRKIWSKEL